MARRFPGMWAVAKWSAIAMVMHFAISVGLWALWFCSSVWMRTHGEIVYWSAYMPGLPAVGILVVSAVALARIRARMIIGPILLGAVFLCSVFLFFYDIHTERWQLQWMNDRECHHSYYTWWWYELGPCMRDWGPQKSVPD